MAVSYFRTQLRLMSVRTEQIAILISSGGLMVIDLHQLTRSLLSMKNWSNATIWQQQSISFSHITTFSIFLTIRECKMCSYFSKRKYFTCHYKGRRNQLCMPTFALRSRQQVTAVNSSCFCLFLSFQQFKNWFSCKFIYMHIMQLCNTHNMCNVDL